MQSCPSARVLIDRPNAQLKPRLKTELIRSSQPLVAKCRTTAWQTRAPAGCSPAPAPQSSFAAVSPAATRAGRDCQRPPPPPPLPGLPRAPELPTPQDTAPGLPRGAAGSVLPGEGGSGAAALPRLSPAA